jgi:hypothetical protein
MAKQRADFDAMAHARSTALDERESAHHEVVKEFHAEQAAERKRLDEVLDAALGQRSGPAPLAKHMATLNEALK